MEGQIWYYLYVPVFMIGVVVGFVGASIAREREEKKSRKNKPMGWKWPGE